MNQTDFYERRAGVLLHPTSLPSGVLDRDVERWLQLVADMGFSVWQVLPLGEPQGGLSPYQCISAFAMNPALLPDFPPVDEKDPDYTFFCEHNSYWLDDYALFKVLKQEFDDSPWFEWPEEWKFRRSSAMHDAHERYHAEITALAWQQYQLHKRWQEIRDIAASKGILLFGDLPIFVGHDSTDVWAHPERFLLDENGRTTVVTGVPPDYFSETGQRWGNPHYDWDAMREHDFDWWLSRIDHHLEQFDLLRIDHFRGLESVWVIDAACETAIEGYWQKVPGDELLSHVHVNGQLPIVAEDLGIITPEVRELRKEFHLPGMSILQFGFDEHADNPHKPENIEEDTVVYTGTHDNDTTKGWFHSLEDHGKNYVLQSLGLMDEHHQDWHAVQDAGNLVVDTLISNAMNSRASLCMIPMQDCMRLDSDARMNIPGTTKNNWRWQFRWEQLEDERIDDIRERIEAAHRLNEDHG